MIQKVAETRIVELSPYHTPNRACVRQPDQGNVNGLSRPQIRKILWGKGPTPPVSLYPSRYLLFNRLTHVCPYTPAGKNTALFLQEQGVRDMSQSDSSYHTVTQNLRLRFILCPMASTKGHLLQSLLHGNQHSLRMVQTSHSSISE